MSLVAARLITPNGPASLDARPDSRIASAAYGDDKPGPKLAGRSASDPCALPRTATTPLLRTSPDRASDTDLVPHTIQGFCTAHRDRVQHYAARVLLIASLPPRNLMRAGARVSGKIPQIVRRVPPEPVVRRCVGILALCSFARATCCFAVPYKARIHFICYYVP
jgi:hypothetical protein